MVEMVIRIFKQGRFKSLSIIKNGGYLIIIKRLNEIV